MKNETILTGSEKCKKKKDIYFRFLSFSMHGKGDTPTQTRPDKAVIDGCESFSFVQTYN